MSKDHPTFIEVSSLDMVPEALANLRKEPPQYLRPHLSDVLGISGKDLYMSEDVLGLAIAPKDTKAPLTAACLLLASYLDDLEVAAAPMKPDVFTVCGPAARNIANAIKTVNDFCLKHN